MSGVFFSLSRRRINEDGAQALPALAPLCTYLALAPYLGAEAACDVANAYVGRRRDPAAVKIDLDAYRRIAGCAQIRVEVTCEGRFSCLREAISARHRRRGDKKLRRIVNRSKTVQARLARVVGRDGRHTVGELRVTAGAQAAPGARQGTRRGRAAISASAYTERRSRSSPKRGTRRRPSAELCSLSGVSSRSFYDLFAGKHELFLETLKAVIELADRIRGLEPAVEHRRGRSCEGRLGSSRRDRASTHSSKWSSPSRPRRG